MMQLMTCYQTWKMNEDFAKSTGADLTVMPGGEHWFHTDEQTEFRNGWLDGFRDTI